MKTIQVAVRTFAILGAFACLGCGSHTDADIQYAALGASDAVGVGADPPTKGYVYLIQDGVKQGGKSVNLLNYGVPDIEIGGIRDSELFALDTGPKPDLVTLFTGTNDIIAGATPGHFESDLDAILNHLYKIDSAKVFIGDLPALEQLPRFQSSPDPDVTPARVSEFNSIIHRLAAKYGAYLVPLAQQPVVAAEISGDGLHPNNQGYEKIAEVFLQEINPVIYADSSRKGAPLNQILGRLAPPPIENTGLSATAAPLSGS